MLRHKRQGTIGAAATSMLLNTFASLPSALDPLFPEKPVLPLYNYSPKAYTGPSVEEVSRLRSAHIPAAVFTFYRKPLMLVEGKMQYVFDETGRRYLDGYSGVSTVSVGHCHPKVVGAIQKQVFMSLKIGELMTA